MATAPELARGVIDYGKGAMKGLIQISLGAAGALLAFIGYLMVNGLKAEALAFSLPLTLFLAAGVAACAGMGFSYLSQNRAWLAHCYIFWDDVAAHDQQRASSMNWMCLAVCAVLLAFILCALGIGLGYSAFMSL